MAWLSSSFVNLFLMTVANITHHWMSYLTWLQCKKYSLWPVFWAFFLSYHNNWKSSNLIKIETRCQMKWQKWEITPSKIVEPSIWVLWYEFVPMLVSELNFRSASACLSLSLPYRVEGLAGSQSIFLRGMQRLCSFEMNTTSLEWHHDTDIR